MTREQVLYMASSLFGTGLYAMWAGPRSATALIGTSAIMGVLAFFLD